MQKVQWLMKNVQQFGGLIIMWLVVFGVTVFLVNIVMQNWLLKN